MKNGIPGYDENKNSKRLDTVKAIVRNRDHRVLMDPNSSQDEKFLQCAYDQALKSPVLMRHGAVIVTNGKIMEELILEELNPKYLTPKYRAENKTNPLHGHCYHTTQAMYYFFKSANLKIMRGKCNLWGYHWW